MLFGVSAHRQQLLSFSTLLRCTLLESRKTQSHAGGLSGGAAGLAACHDGHFGNFADGWRRIVIALQYTWLDIVSHRSTYSAVVSLLNFTRLSFSLRSNNL